MLSVKAGDLDKMGLLFERHHNALFGFVFRMTGQRAFSEDLVQTVFYRMLKYRHTYKGNGEFKTWMYHLTRNLIKDTFRKNNKVDYHENIGEIAKNIAERAADEILEQKHESEKLNRMLNRLKPENKEILVLSKYQELNYKEISEVLNTTETNVKVKVHRAMKELKKMYLQKSI
ncbi:DNA-directed RNA polymerase subunit sigma-24 [Jiulongibacter sediminis]|uniref:DNA-directed RNA polymerase subunit sigma-24 n=2 Tax=Jiulongibacter sediminis TaxID=1605367 RepID=A0A0P7C5W6_9BACT|nr:DNA-directed RNA polymerase subunit sigma-24 [Jiulongibacter sediminis]TBX25264.1 DNA-directed RNA polymerase subunit sigma-24 [Jiulongibacter sediminis]